MKKWPQAFICILMALVLSFSSFEGVLAEVVSHSSTGGNEVPAGFVDEGNIALEEILEYFPEETPAVFSRSAVAKKKIEVVFVVDATGSMSGAIANVKRNIASFAQCFSGEQYTLRLGLVEYKDTTVDGMDSTLIHTVGHTPWLNTTSFISELTKVSVNGGGDNPETPIDAMGYLTGSSFAWSSDAYKYAVLVTDAGYKTTNRHGIGSLAQLGQLLIEREIRTSVITAASYYSDYGEFAAVTGGIVENIYDDFGNTLTEYAYSIMGDVQSKASYTIRVLDSDMGVPVQGAQITGAGDPPYVTDADGKVTMELKSNELANLTLSASGYQSVTGVGLLLSQNSITDIELHAVPIETGDSPLFDFSIFENPDSGSSELAGPKITLLGHTIDLLKLPLEVKLDLFSYGQFKTKIDKENREIDFMVGINVEPNKDGDDPRWTKEWHAVQNVVKAFTGKKMDSKAWNQYQKDTAWMRKKQAVGFPSAGYALVYGTWSWASGEGKLKESGFIIGVSSSFEDLTWKSPKAEWSWKFLPVAPWAYVKASLADLSGKVTGNLYQNDKGKIGVFNSLKLEGAVKPNVGIYAGVDKVASIGGGVEGNIGLGITFPIKKDIAKSLSLGAELDWFVELKVLGFKSKFQDKLAWFTLFPEVGGGFGPKMLRMMRSPDFEVIPRATRPFSIFRGPILPEAIYKEEYVYSDSRPTLVSLDDGRTMLLWLKDDIARSSINKSSLAYSIYDGSKWSSPTIVENDGTPDYIYTTAVANGKVYVLWEDASKSFTNSDSVDEVAKNVGLSYAEFDGTEFSSATQITGLGNGMFMPTLAVNNSNVTAIWVENDQNDPLLSDGNNTIYYCQSLATGWTSPQMLASTAEQLEELTAAVMNSDTYVVYVEGAETGSRIMVSSDMASPKQFYEGDMVGAVQFENERLYWTDGANLSSTNDFITTKTEIENIRGNGFRVISNDSNKAILFEETDGYVVNVGVYYQDGDGWHNPTMLTSGNGRYEMLSGTLDDDNRIVMAYQYNVMDATGGEPIQSSHMMVSRYIPAGKLESDEFLYYDFMSVKPDADLELTMTVRNVGTAPFGSFNVVLSDEKGTLLSTKTITDTLAIGEEKDILFTYHLPTTIEGRTLTAELRNNHGEVLPGEKIRAVAEIGHGDLEITMLELTRTESGVDAVATIRNQGCYTMKGNELTVKVGGEAGEIVATKSIKNLSPDSVESVTVTIPASKLIATDQYDYKIIRFEVESESDEVIFYNNAAEKLLDPIPVESVELDKHTLEMSVGQTASIGVTCLPSTAANRSVVWHCSNLDVLDVDPNTGSIKALREGVATVTAVSEHRNFSDLCTVRVGSGSLSVSGVRIDGADKVAVDGTIVLTAIVEPDTALNKTVQWYCDNTNCTIIPGMNGTVVVEGITPGESKITVVTADGGYTSEKTIKVVEGVRIQIEPADQQVSVGQSAAFNVVAVGDGLSYQWFVKQGESFAKIDGATSSSYATDPVTLEQDGTQYYCQITDANGVSVNSRVATLHVISNVVVPSTGDSSTPLLWLVMTMLSCLGIVVCFNQAKKKAAVKE